MRSSTVRALAVFVVVLAAPAPGAAQDADWDLVADAADACPAEAETYDGTTDADGCPEPGAEPLVVATRDGIDLVERVRFELDDDEIRPESFPALDVLAATIAAHPELGLVRIEGHMDPATWREIRDGSHRVWLERARAVVAYLVARGVPAARLVADSEVTSEPLCDSSVGPARRRRACRTRNDRIVVRFAR